MIIKKILQSMLLTKLTTMMLHMMGELKQIIFQILLFQFLILIYIHQRQKNH